MEIIADSEHRFIRQTVEKLTAVTAGTIAISSPLRHL